MKEHSDREVEKFAQAAEEHIRALADLSVMCRRPVDTVFNAPGNLFRLGVLLSLAQVGLHRVLDFGAGTCWLSALLNKMGVSVISVDVSPTALKAGQALFESDPSHNMELAPLFISYDGKTLPLEDECVDRAICFDAFHHVPNSRRMLAEIYRVLRPGGIFAMSEPGLGHSSSPEAARERERFGTLERDIDIEELVEIAVGTGFGPVRASLDTLPGPMVVDIDDYRRFMKGRDRAFPRDEVRGHLMRHTAVALHKGVPVVDSRRPARLDAAIELIDGPDSCAPGDELTYRLQVKNRGDTIWLKDAPYGGYVRLGAHLLDAKGTMARYEYGRGSLQDDARPGQDVETQIRLVAPERGRWLVEFDMVDEGVAWFYDANPETSKCAIALNVL